MTHPSASLGYEVWLGVMIDIEQKYTGLINEMATFTRGILERIDDPDAIRTYLDQRSLSALEGGDE